MGSEYANIQDSSTYIFKDVIRVPFYCYGIYMKMNDDKVKRGTGEPDGVFVRVACPPLGKRKRLRGAGGAFCVKKAAVIGPRADRRRADNARAAKVH